MEQTQINYEQANGAAAQRLQIITLNAVSTERCRNIYKNEDVEVHDSHICTLTKAGEGACNVSRMHLCESVQK